MYSGWTTLPFSKHKGKTLPQIVLMDPDWFYWAWNKGVFNKSNKKLRQEAKDIFFKTRNIKLPTGKELECRYDRNTYKLDAATVVDTDTDMPSDRGSFFVRFDGFNLNAPRYHYDFKDKTGFKIILKTFKYTYFGGNVRLTRKKAEGFFNDDYRFDLGQIYPKDLFGGYIKD